MKSTDPATGAVHSRLAVQSTCKISTNSFAFDFGLSLPCHWLAFWLAFGLPYGLPLACLWLAFGLPLCCLWLAFGLLLACLWLALGLVAIIGQFGCRMCGGYVRCHFSAWKARSGPAHFEHKMSEVVQN